MTPLWSERAGSGRSLQRSVFILEGTDLTFLAPRAFTPENEIFAFTEGKYLCRRIAWLRGKYSFGKPIFWLQPPLESGFVGEILF